MDFAITIEKELIVAAHDRVMGAVLPQGVQAYVSGALLHLERKHGRETYVSVSCAGHTISDQCDSQVVTIEIKRVES